MLTPQETDGLHIWLGHSYTTDGLAVPESEYVVYKFSREANHYTVSMTLG